MEAQSSDGAQKVPLYSISDLKNATDDALAPYLTNLPSPYTFKQSHYYTNIRLAAGYTAVVIAAATFYFDWKLGWDATKHYTTGACVLYFICNAFLTLWIWKFEAGKVFVGFRGGQQKLTLQSSATKHVPVYKLKVMYQAPSEKIWEDKEIEGRFTEWFNKDGYLEHGELARWLASNIEVVGMADPQHKKSVDRKIAETSAEPPIELTTPEATAPGSSKNTRRTKRRA